MKKLIGMVFLAVAITALTFNVAKCLELTGSNVTADQSIAEKFTRHTVTGISTPLPQSPDVPGFKGASYLTIGDIDGDSIKEIICTSGVGLDGDAYTADDGAVAVYTWDGSDIDSWEEHLIRSDFAFPNETVLRDMDGDTDLDIMVMDNFIAGWFTCGLAGIYYLENPDNNFDVTWEKKTIYQGVIDGTCPCSPSGGGTCTDGVESYHRVVFLDMDGDGDEDFVTTKIHMWKWQWTSEQYVWVEWFRKETTGYSGPYEIGDGAGFLFNMFDIDGDGDLDVAGPQFFIHDPGGLVIKGYPDGSDPWGDTLIWFENPGQAAMLANPNLEWTRYTIDNWYITDEGNRMGQGMEIILSDIDDDGDGELLFSNHNHQDYKPADPPHNRIWPSGIYAIEIPEVPTVTANWLPIPIDTGDPDLDPTNPWAVAFDTYAVDRAGGPYSQGSPGMVRAGNISSNRYPDIVVPGDGKGALYYYQNDGVTENSLNTRRASLYVEAGCMPGEAEIVDIDGDGYMDIVAAIYDTSVDKADPLESSSIFIFKNRDADNDGKCNPGDSGSMCTGSDNCPFDYNPLQEDLGDGDGVGDACDNCPTDYNPGQEDTMPPGGNWCGDLCECEGNFDGDADVDGSDAFLFKSDFFRKNCKTSPPCHGDFECDGDVDGSDAFEFKADFFRKDCPSCEWACGYE